jgi:hypothetical protein
MLVRNYVSVHSPSFSAQILIFPRVPVDISCHVDGSKSLKRSMIDVFRCSSVVSGVEISHKYMCISHGIIFVVEKRLIVLTAALLFH